MNAQAAERQPLHVLYGGAHLYKHGSARRIGEVALAAIERHASGPGELVRAAGLAIDASLARRVQQRVIARLELEPVEDQRIDFEDGFGIRSANEIEEQAIRCARELARGMRDRSLPRSIGIRIAALANETGARATGTLELFVRTLVAEAGALPPGFVVTLPKISGPEQPRALVRCFERLEKALSLEPGTLRLEMMIELPQAIVAGDGRSALPILFEACEGRCRGAHLGTYDLTAACGVPARAQAMDHPIAQAALDAMQLALAGRTWLSDGATTLLPIGSTEEVHAGWRAMARDVRRSLDRGIVQGWDLHPAQIPIRLAVVQAYHLEHLDREAERLRAFLDRAAGASRVGALFDDAATGQGLLNTMLRALDCGAIDEAELARAGITTEEARSRSFARILADRERR